MHMRFKTLQLSPITGWALCLQKNCPLNTILISLRHQMSSPFPAIFGILSIASNWLKESKKRILNALLFLVGTAYQLVKASSWKNSPMWIT